MTSKATRRARRQKRNQIALAGAAPVEHASPKRGRPPAEDPRKTALNVRAKQLVGKGIGIAEAERLASSQMAGCAVGQRILADVAPAEREVLWNAVQHMRGVWSAYDRAIGAPARHAISLGILAPTEAMQADASSPGRDDRPEADRARAAVSAFMALQGWLDYVDRPARSATINTVVDDQPIHDWPGILAALRCVAEGRQGQRIAWRGRSGEKGT